MTKINIDNIFDLFSSDNDWGKGSNTIYIDFTNTPIYWIGMYKKMVLYHDNFNKKVIEFFREVNKELDSDDVKEAGEFIVYEKAWDYIRNIDINNDEHIDVIKKYCDEYLDVSLKLGISFFEQYEEYEKCAFLKQILNKSQEFSK
jgi:hypothetical protein